MFLRKNRRRIDGETYEYWTLCESVRTERGPRQRVVATLGKLDDDDLRAGWDQIEALLDGRQPGPRQPELPNGTPEAPPQPGAWELADLSRIEVGRVREFGSVFLGLALWRRLGLHELLDSLIEPGREEVAWADVAAVLTVGKFCGQASELGIAESWYARTALEDIAGIPADAINDDRLYRALDTVGAHKDRLCEHLMKRDESWFGVNFEFLLHDVTSTNFEVFAGNRTDVTTVGNRVRKMEERFGKAQRVWVMDRGMVSEANIAMLRERKALYVVGTPKSQLRAYEADLAEKEGWVKVQHEVEARLVAHPDGDGRERFVLCRSTARGAKERAMDGPVSGRSEMAEGGGRPGWGGTGDRAGAELPGAGGRAPDAGKGCVPAADERHGDGPGEALAVDHAADAGGGGVPDGEERHWAEACFPPEERAGGCAPAGVLPEPGAVADLGDVDEGQGAWDERTEAGGGGWDDPLDGRERAGEKRGS